MAEEGKKTTISSKIVKTEAKPVLRPNTTSTLKTFCRAEKKPNKKN